MPLLFGAVVAWDIVHVGSFEVAGSTLAPETIVLGVLSAYALGSCVAGLAFGVLFVTVGVQRFDPAARVPDPERLRQSYHQASSTLQGVMADFALAVSMGLQHGVPLETFVQKFVNDTFEPHGITDDPDIRFAKSLMDYIFRRLALDFLPDEKRIALGIRSVQEREDALNGRNIIEPVVEPAAEPAAGSTAELVPALERLVGVQFPERGPDEVPSGQHVICQAEAVCAGREVVRCALPNPPTAPRGQRGHSVPWRKQGRQCLRDRCGFGLRNRGPFHRLPGNAQGFCEVGEPHAREARPPLPTGHVVAGHCGPSRHIAQLFRQPSL